MTGRSVAVAVLLVLAAALVATIVVTTPWQPLDDAGAGGRSAGTSAGVVADGPAVAADPSRDFTVAERAREDAYHRSVWPPAYLSLGVGLIFTIALGLTPLGARLVQAVGSPFGATGGTRWAVQLALGAVAVTLLGRLLVLPIDARAFAVRRDYGLATQSWPAWLVDVAKSWALSTGLLVVVVLALYALVRAFPRGWWAPAALGGAALVIALSFLYPVVVEPLFNKFTPMPDGALRTSLLDLAQRDGVPARDVLVADASRRTTALNAYVSGFGSTRRIVVYDTLLEQASPEEVRLVVAHELGHAKEGDVLHGTVVGALAVAVGACALFLVVTAPVVLRRAGVGALADPRSLALVLVVATLIATVAGPVQLLVSRRIEARADVHSLQLTQDPRAFVAMQRRLAVTNLSDLDPPAVVLGLFSSHPTAPQRIALARTWARRHGAPDPPPAISPPAAAERRSE
jgi:STE24 endopeptidase